MATLIGDTVLEKQVDYKQLKNSHPTPRYLRLVPQSGTQTFNLSSAALTECIIEIPTQVHNWWDSYLSFDVSVPDPGNLLYSWMINDTMSFIQQIQLYTRLT